MMPTTSDTPITTTQSPSMVTSPQNDVQSSSVANTGPVSSHSTTGDLSTDAVAADAAIAPVSVSVMPVVTKGSSGQESWASAQQSAKSAFPFGLAAVATAGLVLGILILYSGRRSRHGAY